MTDESGTQRTVPGTWSDGERIHLVTDVGPICPHPPRPLAAVDPETVAVTDLCKWCQHIASTTGAIELPAHLRKRGVVA